MKLTADFPQRGSASKLVDSHGVKCKEMMNNIPRFKKVEVLVLGVVLPVVLISHTVLLLSNADAVFWGRGSNAVYHGSGAYLVSLLWFGVAGLLIGHFCLRTYQIFSPANHRMLMWVSAILVLVGLVSAIVLV